MNMRASQSRSPRPYRMGARAEAAEATGQRILDAARQLFSALLYDQVSLQSVASRAGVTVQTVIRRFGSKEGLFAAVADQRSAEIRAERDRAGAGDTAAAISNLVDSYERWGDEQLHLLAQERRTDGIANAVSSARRYHHAWVERIFAPWLRDLPTGQRQRRFAELVAVTDLYVWKILRRDRGLSRRETESAVRDLVSRLIAP